MNADWEADDRTRIECVHVGKSEIRAGDRVRIQPRRRADVMDLVLRGKVATVAAIEQDLEQNIFLAVVINDDPGADFGYARQAGHRFFFALDEVEPVEASARRIRPFAIEVTR